MSSLNLKDCLAIDPHRPQVVADCAALVDDQVKQKSGLTGVAIKAAYTTIKSIKKGFVPEVIDDLLDDWLTKLQPFYDTWAAGAGGTLAGYLATRTEDVAEALLEVTDERAEKSKHGTARKAYQKMRGSAKKHVMEAIPPLGRLLERHLEDKG